MKQKFIKFLYQLIGRLESERWNSELYRLLMSWFYNHEALTTKSDLLPYIAKFKMIKEGDACNLQIWSTRPGRIVGKGGKQIKDLESYLNQHTPFPVKITIWEIVHDRKHKHFKNF